MARAVKLAPDMAPKVKTALEEWSSIHKVPTDRIIEKVGPDKFDQIDQGIDQRIDNLNLPE